VLTGLPARSHVFFTSGSTGVPVGVVRTAEAVLADARRVAPTLDYAPDRPVVAAVPLFHVYGFNYALVGPLVAGASVRYCAARSVPSQLARVVRGHRAATLVALPAHYGLLAGTPDLLEPVWDERLGTLRKAVTAGAPLAPGVAATIAARFAFALYNCYGSSEAGAITLMRTIGGEERGDVGTPLPGIATRTVTTDVGLAAAELLLRSDSLAAGRLGPLGLVPLTDEDGWYRTGDLVDIGRPGGIRLVGRAGAVINVAGEKVSPAVIERVLADHPAVVDVQVVAAADVARGQVPLARVVLSDPSAAPALLGWCRGRLAPHEVPRQIDVVGELPRSATGKIITSTVTEERL
jgi:long-chain acyl-CoA synthetase